MTRKALLPQRPRHILVYDEDWDFLRDAYGPGSAKPVGISPAIRTIIHAFCQRLRQREADLVEGALPRSADTGNVLRETEREIEQLEGQER
jgi:hypothetical protein